MEIPFYLAMTQTEMKNCPRLPQKRGWMACHFSPYGTGLSNLPGDLPPDSILMLNDRFPCRGHDPARIREELAGTVEKLSCCGVLLDFQRPVCADTEIIVRELVMGLPCPVAVSEGYSHIGDCPVFVAPCPHHVPLGEHLAPWVGREVWLDLAADREILQVTAEGAEILPLPMGEIPEECHRDDTLHCSYSIELSQDAARFSLWRTPEQLMNLARDATALGVSTMVGLYQEFKSYL